MVDERAGASDSCASDALSDEGSVLATDRGGSSSELCRSCGLCCDGTLFGYVPVSTDEAQRLRHRLPILVPSGNLEPRFEQRCVALGPRGCDVYDERPGTCSTYRCKLLRRVEAGELAHDAARHTLTRILVLVDRLDSTLPPGKNLLTRIRLLDGPGAEASKQGAELLGETWLDVKLLDLLLNRELRVDPASSGSIGDIVSAGGPSG